MNHQNGSTMVPKLPKGQLKCFNCRTLFAIKEGKWMNWENMQVFLCKNCDKVTAKAPERNHPD